MALDPGTALGPYQVQGETLRATHGLSVGSLGSVEILVRRTDADTARDLIAKAERGELSVPDMDPDQTSTSNDAS